MKIRVIQKASPVRKPQSFCPWVSENDGTQDKKN